MTEIEAKKEIEHNVFCNTDNFEMTISKECYKTIINALEKQIPKKIAKYDVCPVCNNNQSTTWYYVGSSYCEICGQKLDWNE